MAPVEMKIRCVHRGMKPYIFRHGVSNFRRHYLKPKLLAPRDLHHTSIRIPTPRNPTPFFLFSAAQNCFKQPQAQALLLPLVPQTQTARTDSSRNSFR